MSVEASSWAFAQQGLSSGAKLLLVAIANRCDKSGVCFPGRESLAVDCCCRAATVSANMRALEHAKLLVRFQRRRQNKSRTSDWLVVAPYRSERGPMIDAHADEVPSVVAEAARKRSGAVSAPTETVGAVSGPGQVRFSGGPEPSEEPETEESKLSSVSSPNPLLPEFEEWCAHHSEVTDYPPLRKGTAAYRARLAEFSARRVERYLLADLKFATVGAFSDEFRRSNGHYGHQSILRPTKIADLVAKGKRASAGDGEEDRKIKQLRQYGEEQLRKARE